MAEACPGASFVGLRGTTRLIHCQGKEHQYRLHASQKFLLLRFPNDITFTTVHAYKLPDSRYIELHALACEVAHMSGAAEYIADTYRDVHETPVLAHDGSSADVLGRYLALVAPVQ